ncbi:hypothetical protein HQ39_03235 [Porphyromonas sp. COT-108 OH2963]|uniref:hypothetical protein n=1 Tax=Porphyromonas sp. COT-108 OH2963 TaxID=1515614 RepID=UPI00052BEB43|nr:hypothetical protein [Porphyromonas sp. COT-108 OH2963]KGN95991.1 hypothetical protein HQ39_03235 [Porphyromonas sp. COT-108 OH2963]
MKHHKDFFLTLLFLLSPAIWGGCSDNGEEKTVDPNYEKTGYYGNVKFVKSTLFYINSDSVWISQSDYEFSEFDQKGQLMAEGFRSSNDLPRDEYSYQYNENGKKTGYTHLLAGGIKYTGTYKYDPKTGLLMEELCVEQKINDDFDAEGGDEPTFEESVYKKETYLYDDKNNLIEKHCHETPDSNPNYQKYAYTYDEQNRVLEEITFVKKSKTEPDSKKSYKYDSKGRVIEEIEELFLSKLDRSPEKIRVSRKFDNKGNLVEEVKEEKGKKHITTYTYTYKKGKLIEETTETSAGEKTVITHEDNGNTITINYKDNKMTTKSVTEHDKYGNPQKTITYHVNETTGQLEAQYMLLYEIVYHE